jgi:hypothetical protein
MPMLVVVTDSDAMPAFERALIESGDLGFTVVPTVWGRGRSGMHAGDRVHPGGSSLLFLVASEQEVASAAELLRGVRDRENVAETTRMFAVEASEMP